MPKKKKDNPGFVTIAECNVKSEAFRDEIRDVKDDTKTLKNAIVGENLQGGIVKKLTDLEKKLAVVTVYKDIILPIAVTVITALIIKFTGV